VPGPPEGMVQIVDVRDLGDWIVDLAERRESGAFNATNPGLPWSDLVESCLRVTAADAKPVWVDSSFLADQGVGEWIELPLWLSDADSLGMMQADVSRAVDSGLTFRPLDETVRGALERAETTEGVGLAPDRERELIEAWRRG
jgi:2'-hydroxyisoflavone reductase